MPIQINELHCPHLPQPQLSQLFTTLVAVEAGAGVATVHMTYNKQTKSKPRIAGEDYVAMPGMTPEVQIGQITSVFVGSRTTPRTGVRARSALSGSVSPPSAVRTA